MIAGLINGALASPVKRRTSVALLDVNVKLTNRTPFIMKGVNGQIVPFIQIYQPTNAAVGALVSILHKNGTTVLFGVNDNSTGTNWSPTITLGGCTIGGGSFNGGASATLSTASVLFGTGDVNSGYQFFFRVAGSSSTQMLMFNINNRVLYLGDGNNDSSVTGNASGGTDGTVSGMPGRGTNISGSILYVNGGYGTGNANPGPVIIRSSIAGSSGTTAQTLSNMVTFQGLSTGNVLMQSLGATHKLLVLKGASSQSGNLLEIQDSGGTVLAFFSPTTFRLNCFNGFNTISFFTPGNGWTADLIGHSEGQLKIQGFPTVDKFNFSTQGEYFNIGNGTGGTVAIASSPTGGSLTATSGSGTNIAGANLVIHAGRGTGSAAPGVLNLQSTSAGGSGTTIQTLSTVLQITNASTITISDAVNLVLNTTTGTKFGTSALQKMGWWNASPVVQDTGWTITNKSADRVLDCNSTSIDELADVVGTLVDVLKSYGLLGG